MGSEIVPIKSLIVTSFKFVLKIIIVVNRLIAMVETGYVCYTVYQKRTVIRVTVNTSDTRSQIVTFFYHGNNSGSIASKLV